MTRAPLPTVLPVPPQPDVQSAPLPVFTSQPGLSTVGPALLVYRNAALSIPNGFVFTTIPYDTVENPLNQSTSYFNATTGVFTVPFPGVYDVNAEAIFNAAGAYTVALQATQNGVTGYRLGTGYNGAGNAAAQGTRGIRCRAGDTLIVVVAQNSAVNPAPLFVGQALCWAQFVWRAPLS